MEYIDQLNALLILYNQAEIADLLDVTERTIQNWREEENPSKPHQKTIRKIGDVYKKLIEEEKSIEEISNTTQKEVPFIEARRKKNNIHQPFMVPFIPIKAQAGYVKAIDQEIYLDTLEKYALPPGVSGHGAIWRYWEVEGDSMIPSFREGDIVLTSYVHPMDWENLKNFYVYVLVTKDRILIKRIYCKNQLEWVLISDNEDVYGQEPIPAEDVKEVWIYRKTWSTRAEPPKRFEIKV